MECLRDTTESIQKTINFFKNCDPSVDLQFPQYFVNTVFGYKFNDKTIRDFTRKFWEIYTEEDIKYRDQPLWNFLLLKYDHTPLECDYLFFEELEKNTQRSVYFLPNSKSKTRVQSSHN